MSPGIDEILSELRSTVGLAHNAEVTLEMDPGTFDLDKLTQLSAAGITRLSLGIQSFDSTILEKCGRAHTVDDVARALKLVMSSDFKDNFSIDLISSLPGLSIDLWKNTLECAAASGCSHISVYDLQVEDKTAFGRWYSPGVFPLPSDEESARMYCMAAEILKPSGFEHYEVSNYAKPSKRSQHNQRYWKCKSTWGFGMGAASFIANNRYTRPDRMADYAKWVDTLEIKGFKESTVTAEDDEEDQGKFDASDIDNDGRLVVSDEIVNGGDVTDILEVVMLALRTSDGLNLNELAELYGKVSVEKVLQAVLPFRDQGLIEIKEVVEESTLINGQVMPSLSVTKTVCLTDPQGFLLSNDIISSVFVELTC